MRLSANFLALVLFIATFPRNTSAQTTACSAGSTDIVLVIDGSASIDPASFTTIKNASVDFATQAFDRISNLRIGGVFYGDDESAFLPLSGDVNTVATAIRGIAQPDNAGTMTNKGIDAATAMFQASSSSKEIMVVITDGISNRRDLTQQSAKAAKDPPNNIEIYTVGIIYKFFGDPTLIGMFNDETTNMASSQDKVITVEEFRTLAADISGILNQICISNLLFTPELTDVTVNQGVTLSFSATINQAVSGGALWFSPTGSEITPGGRYTLSSTGNSYTLTIVNALPSDEGIYSLSVAGVRTSARLTVLTGTATWSEWNVVPLVAPCSQSCGEGTQQRTYTRQCLGTDICPGSSTKTTFEPCNIHSCSSTWSEWNVVPLVAPCSQSCGEGTQQRTYTRQCLGTDICPGSSTKTTFEPCNIHSCSSTWSEWNLVPLVAPCSQSCGEGTQQRTYTRQCLGTDICPGSSTKTTFEPCNIQSCSLTWGQWSEVSRGQCSVTCGPGSLTVVRTRVCLVASCSGLSSDTQTEPCNLRSCPVCGNNLDVILAIDGSNSINNVPFFNQFIPAIADFISTFLSTSSQRRLGYVLFSTVVDSTVDLTNNANFLDTSIRGEDYPNANTNTHLALSAIRERFAVSGNPSATKLAIVITDGSSNNPAATQSEGTLLKNSGVDVIVVGITNRVNQEEISNLASAPSLAFNATSFSDLTGVLTSLYNDCPATWGTWVATNQVSACSVTCGTGSAQRTYTRSCSTGSNIDCIGSSTKTESEICTLQQCPGTWGTWQFTNQVSACSVTCGTGSAQRTYTRTCSTGNNFDCVGSSTKTESEVCTLQQCPATWGQWTETDRSVCSQPCGQGVQRVNRFRTCLTGNNCFGNSADFLIVNCNESPCTLIAGLVDIVIYEGTSVDFSARVSGANLQGAVWTKDGVVVSGTRFQSGVDGTLQTLRIITAEMGDAGIYQLAVGGVTTSARLTVLTIQGTWSTWTVVSQADCNVTCGTGVARVSRQRTCSTTNCPGEAIDITTVPCTLDPCSVCTPNLDVFLAIDGSNSINNVPFFNQFIPAVADFISKFLSTSSQRRLGYVLFSSVVESTVDLTNNANFLDTSIRGEDYPNANTNTHLALSEISQRFAVSGNPSARKLAIVITDGSSNNPAATQSEGTLLKNSGVDIIAVGFTNRVNRDEIQNLASSPDLAIFATDLTELTTVLTNLYSDCPVVEWSPWIATSVVTACSVSCGDGTRSRTHSRTCNTTGTALTCPGNPTKQEIEFCNERACLAVTARLIDLVVFEGSTVELNARLSEANLQGAVWTKDGVPVSGARFQSIVDGTLQTLRITGAELTDAGVYELTVGGVTTSARLTVLQAQGVWSDWTEVSVSACSVTCGTGVVTVSRTRACSNNNCQGDSSDTITRPCTQNACSVCTSNLDVFLAIDGSNSINNVPFFNQFIPAVADFISNFLSTSSQRRLGYVLFSSVVESTVDLTNNANFLDTSIRNEPYPNENTNTHLAISTIRQRFAVSSNPSASKLAIVITDGSSNNPAATQSEGTLLKNSGVDVIAVGFTDRVNRDEIQNLASSPDLAIFATDLTELTTVLTNLYSDCPVVEWSPWTATSVVTACSETCGDGTRSRTYSRTCNTTGTALTCPGSPTKQEIESCNLGDCVIAFGQWTTWGFWTPNCPTCGTSQNIQQVRTRVCVQLQGEQPCVGDRQEIQNIFCNLQSCEGTWFSWGQWSVPNCPSCGLAVTRTRTRTRSCNRLPTQTACIGDSTDTDVITCSISNCIGTWGNWGVWVSETCPTCGPAGTQVRRTRDRNCFRANPTDDFCPGNDQEIDFLTCNIQPCAATWLTWGAWSAPACPACGLNIRRDIIRTRVCDSLPTQAPCTGAPGAATDIDNVACNIPNCVGSWATWTQWTLPACPDCGPDGIQRPVTRTRTCVRNLNTDDFCPGLNSEARLEDCILNACPTSQWSTWNPWISNCPTTCVGVGFSGTQTRTRNCIRLAGTDCAGVSVETVPTTCLLCAADWNVWGAWSPPANCPACGLNPEGSVFRTRTCTPVAGQPSCPGENIQTDTRPCTAVTNCRGFWEQWTQWGTPSCVACGPSGTLGVSTRSRGCVKNNAADDNCVGATTETSNQPCSIPECTAGQWTDWSDWSSACPVCGTNVNLDQSRFRTCNREPSQAPCQGTDTERRSHTCVIPTCSETPGLCAEVRNVSGVGFRYHPTDCDKYIQCYFNPNGEVTAVLRPCPFGHYWSQDAMRCRLSWKVECPLEKCKDDCVGSYKMEGSCRAYWSCEKGRSQAECCPAGFRFVPTKGCQLDLTCHDPCPTPCNNFDACDKAPIWTNKASYNMDVGLLGWMEGQCYAGAYFDILECGCSYRKNTTCDPEFSLDFNDNTAVTTASGSWLSLDNVNVENGVAKFTGVGKMAADTRLEQQAPGCPFVLKFKFLLTGRGIGRQVLASSSNCDAHVQGNSMVISLHNNTVLFELKTWYSTLLSMPLHTDGIDLSQWTDISFLYDGKMVTVVLKQLNYRVMGQLFAPRVNVGGCGLMFGSDGSILTAMDGHMDDIHVYKCDPGDLY